MDDYKRTLYMIALRDLQELQRAGNRSGRWLCVMLATVLRHESRESASCLSGSIDDLVQEFFPEFLELFDGNYWNPTQDAHKQSYSAVAAAWWPKDWLEPRIRILECILRD